ncbi:MAG: guanylate kinase [Desulfamplus sp.]|nr:guanylate kinase [Desulfamplus sp.]
MTQKIRQSETKTETELKPEKESKNETKPKPELETKSKPELETKPKTELETKPKIELETEEERRDTRGKIFVVSAPSGAGKTTLCTKILAQFPELSYSVSHTTRQPRASEKDGIDYFFITVNEFKKRIEANLWAEWAEVHGNFYGTSLDFIEVNLSKGNHLLLDIDVQGAKKIRQSFPEAITIFIMPPSIEVLEERLKKRETDSEEVIAKRIANAVNEIAQSSFYQHIIVNDNLEHAEKELATIIAQIRSNK